MKKLIMLTIRHYYLWYNNTDNEVRRCVNVSRIIVNDTPLNFGSLTPMAMHGEPFSGICFKKNCFFRQHRYLILLYNLCCLKKLNFII